MSHKPAVSRASTVKKLFVAVALVAISGCEAFEDLTPRNIFFEMNGEAGQQVRVIYSTQFVAGVNDIGVTRVQVVRSDTILHEIPFSRAIDISVDRRWFVQAESLGSDTLEVHVIVDVDDRNLLNESGGIFPNDPWHFVYAFNQLLTRDIDVAF
ncbi:MAG: hypothetical protein OXI50_05825 [Gammaproteobacteria bacterium]|nr:hypothetical protein [Gammaproteobacteria bacterium]